MSAIASFSCPYLDRGVCPAPPNPRMGRETPVLPRMRSGRGVTGEKSYFFQPFQTD